MADKPLNAVNRGVYISDNLPFLESLNDRCVDLVCIDPPFAKNETFGQKTSQAPDPLKPPLSDEEKATEMALLRRWGIRNQQHAADAGVDWPETKYKDFWSWQDIHESWLKNIEDHHPGVHKLIEATQEIHSEGTAAYLCYMAVRLCEIRRVLKDTGSLYLHCDHTTSAYLRQLLDAIFGNGRNGNPGFRNEIAWRRYGSHNDAVRKYGQVRDSILFYVKSKNHLWSDIREPLDEEYVKNAYTYQDERGKYRTAPLHTGGLQGTGYEYEFRGYQRTWRYPEHRMKELENDNRIRQGRAGKGVPERKVYLQEINGKPLSDWWQDINSLTEQNKESTGYPTQKPVALAERIIKASCPEGGVVLDCFAGCAYVAIAAERLKRNWVACDINPRAWTVFKRQFSKPKLALLKCDEPTHNLQKVLLGNTATVHGPRELPTRTTPVEDSTPPAFKLTDKPRQFKTPASIIPELEMLEILLTMSGYQAWCCGFANRMPDGSVVKTTHNFHLDHLNPVSKAGTSHQITNRAPLCPYHNIKKSNHRLHLAEYREKIQQEAELMVNDSSDLIDLDYAFHHTLNIYSARTKQNEIPI